jgi:reactive chlorine resistance protein C
MGKRLIAAENLQAVGASTLRLGLALNLVAIGRLKFEDYEVENIRPLVTSHPMFARLVSKFGEEKLAQTHRCDRDSDRIAHCSETARAKGLGSR